MERGRVAGLSLIIFYPLFGILDYVVYPDFWVFFLSLRLLSCVVVAFSLWFLSINRWGEKHLEQIGIIGIFVVGALQSVMIFSAEGYTSPYYVGFVLFMLGTGLLMPWGAKETSIVCGLLYLSYLVPIPFTGGITDLRLFLFHNSILIVAAILAVTGSYFIHRLRSREFRTRRRLRNALDQLKETQSDLVHAEKMSALGQLVAGIAHEVNNPIGYAFLSLEGIQKDVAQIEEIQKGQKDSGGSDLWGVLRDLWGSIGSLKEGLTRTRDIVANLRTFAQKDRGEFVATDLHQCLDSTLGLLRYEVGDRITIHKDYGEIPEVECLPGQINQVFLNLLRNAIAAIPEKGDIWIQTEKVGGGVRIAVRDNGVGIAPEIRDKIFDPFFTTREVGKGMGLGLSVSDRIIEMHKGTLRVESEVGRGSEFIIEVPIRQTPPG